jgi:hypothetical protein
MTLFRKLTWNRAAFPRFVGRDKQDVGKRQWMPHIFAILRPDVAKLAAIAAILSLRKSSNA